MPLSDQEIATKFHLFADPVVGIARAAEIQELCGAIDQPGAELETLQQHVFAPGCAPGEAAPDARAVADWLLAP